MALVINCSLRFALVKPVVVKSRLSDGISK